MLYNDSEMITCLVDSVDPSKTLFQQALKVDFELGFFVKQLLPRSVHFFFQFTLAHLFKQP